ncbi:hypothetical protein ACFXKC_46200 [Streptomyces sp. NPDC059340]|uniref:hypothetical protein n=1 Tax=Streptomyces sp. NPDC059340 TaxID=3346806 RepID=UPI0036AE4696
MTQPVYATREDVMRAMDSKLTARNTAQIDRAVESASRDVEKLCHRRFYPEVDTRYFDWPNSQTAAPWRLWLDDSELISVTSISSGGTAIAPSNCLLEPNRTGPPYNRLELNIGTNTAFGGGNTYQRDITITGVWGYTDTDTTAGALTAAVSTTTATSLPVNAAASALLGVGSILRVDSERLLVTGRTMATTGQTLGAPGLDAQAKTVTVPVPDGTAYAVDEVLLIDSERMLIVDIAGNQLTVRRGWDGSVLAAHTAGAAIYAPRTLIVTRGALGTVAATHANAAPVYRWEPPGPVRQLVIAEAIATLTAESSGYSKTARSASGSSERNRDQGALQDRRDTTYDACGRHARARAV